MLRDRVCKTFSGQNSGADFVHDWTQSSDIAVVGEQLQPGVKARACSEKQGEVAGKNRTVCWPRPIAPIKKHGLFLEAFARAVSQNSALRAVVGGGGEAEAVSRLAARAEELRVAERFHFLGYRQDLARLYSDLDIVALTSDNEGT